MYFKIPQENVKDDNKFSINKMKLLNCLVIFSTISLNSFFSNIYTYHVFFRLNLSVRRLGYKVFFISISFYFQAINREDLVVQVVTFVKTVGDVTTMQKIFEGTLNMNVERNLFCPAVIVLTNQLTNFIWINILKSIELAPSQGIMQYTINF